MHTITTDSIADGHEKVVRLIMSSQDFNDVTTEDKELTFEYPEPVNIHIRHPQTPPFASGALKFGEKSLESYSEEILKPRPLLDRLGLPDFSYLYSNLIWDYPTGKPFFVFSKEWKRGSNCGALVETKKLLRIDWPEGNGRGDGIDQVSYVVNKLVNNPTSRRCVITLFEPWGHPKMDDPPCLNHIQFMLRNGELNMHALFRSNDMLSAWGANAYALMCLQQTVLSKINSHLLNTLDACDCQYSMGWLETTSISAHIYWNRDKHELDAFRKRWC